MHAKAFKETHCHMPPTTDDYKALLLKIAKQFQKILIVVDALDECAVHLNSHPNRSVFIKSLCSVPNLKLLVTSRNLPEIENLLEEAAELPIQPYNDDIVSYVESRILDEPLLNYNITLELEDQIFDAVAERYSKM
jgi:hypothetical protein